jgi:protein-tyrosine-phosphatase
MKKSNRAGNIPNILFVCYGNTCRSPMAEGLAKKILGDRVRIESAGLTPVFNGATPEAIDLLLEMYGIDISPHRTRNIADVPWGEFDQIIVLDAYVYQTLLRRYSILSDKFVLWDIEDPFGRDLEAFRKTASYLQSLIKKTFISG